MVLSAPLQQFKNDLQAMAGSAKIRSAAPVNPASCGRNSVVECQLPKLDVAGSNPVARFYHRLLAHV
jgi:hypothetical protein